MIPILTVPVTLVLALVVTHTASVALILTGLSRDVARFQARSAFTGFGHTTPESEW